MNFHYLSDVFLNVKKNSSYFLQAFKKYSMNFFETYLNKNSLQLNTKVKKNLLACAYLCRFKALAV